MNLKFHHMQRGRDVRMRNTQILVCTHARIHSPNSVRSSTFTNATVYHLLWSHFYNGIESIIIFHRLRLHTGLLLFAHSLILPLCHGYTTHYALPCSDLLLLSLFISVLLSIAKRMLLLYALLHSLLLLFINGVTQSKIEQSIHLSRSVSLTHTRMDDRIAKLSDPLHVLSLYSHYSIVWCSCYQ